MTEFTKNEELAADCRNKITHAITVLELAVEKNVAPGKKEMKLALENLRAVAEIISRMANL